MILYFFVFKHSSLYWGAASWGQINIAVALKGSVVFSDQWNKPASNTVKSIDLANEIKRKKVAVIGVVPTLLGSFEPSDLEDVQLAFTWGESLRTPVVEKWTSSPIPLNDSSVR